MTLSPRFAHHRRRRRHGARRPRPRALFLAPTARRSPAAARVNNPALADASRRSRAAGRTPSTGGRSRPTIVARGRHRAARDPSTMTHRRSRGLSRQERAPVCGGVSRLPGVRMGPPSSGGVALLQILGQLERFDMKRWARKPDRLAPDRRQPSGSPMPTARLDRRSALRARADRRAARSRLYRAALGADLGRPRARAACSRARRRARRRAPRAIGSEVPGTSHFVAADARATSPS